MRSTSAVTFPAQMGLECQQFAPDAELNSVGAENLEESLLRGGLQQTVVRQTHPQSPPCKALQNPIIKTRHGDALTRDAENITVHLSLGGRRTSQTDQLITGPEPKVVILLLGKRLHHHEALLHKILAEHSQHNELSTSPAPRPNRSCLADVSSTTMNSANAALHASPLQRRGTLTNLAKTCIGGLDTAAETTWAASQLHQTAPRVVQRPTPRHIATRKEGVMATELPPLRQDGQPVARWKATNLRPPYSSCFLLLASCFSISISISFGFSFLLLFVTRVNEMRSP